MGGGKSPVGPGPNGPATITTVSPASVPGGTGFATITVTGTGLAGTGAVYLDGKTMDATVAEVQNLTDTGFTFFLDTIAYDPDTYTVVAQTPGPAYTEIARKVDAVQITPA